MMSVFCLNSLIHAPECGKCILRDPNFQNVPGEHATGQPLEACALTALVFQVSLRLLLKFCHLLHFLLKTLHMYPVETWMLPLSQQAVWTGKLRQISMTSRKLGKRSRTCKVQSFHAIDSRRTTVKTLEIIHSTLSLYHKVKYESSGWCVPEKDCLRWHWLTFSTTWAEVIFRVKWFVYVGRYYKNRRDVIGQLIRDVIGSAVSWA